jgi:predicted secreted protein
MGHGSGAPGSSLFFVGLVYVLVWWIVFLMLLPVAVRTCPEGALAGHEPGAPLRPFLGRKVLAATVLAALATGAFVWLQTPLERVLHRWIRNFAVSFDLQTLTQKGHHGLA